MNRKNNFDYIEERLSILATRIELRGTLNYLDLHLHSEDFYLHFFNKLFGWQLKNLNKIRQNSKAIDLDDPINRIVIQISATATVEKVNSALSNNLFKDSSVYSGYQFKFISISKDASGLRKKRFSNPHALAFDPHQDIYDVRSILDIVTGLEIERQNEICQLIKQELGTEEPPQIPTLTTNLANIINVLAQEDWSHSPTSTKPFDIEQKIQHNKLRSAKTIIGDYKIHHTRVDKIYSDFDAQGINKSISVLDAVRRCYITHSSQYDIDDTDRVFDKIVGSLCEKVMGSANYTPIAHEELELCVNILVVDAFIRCKIFEPPP